MLSINGELVAVPSGGDLSQSLVEFIRTYTRFTVSKRLPRHTDIGPGYNEDHPVLHCAPPTGNE